MNILISNDDGYSAQGIRVLAKRLAKEHCVRIVAPMGERSGTSHSVSFFSGIYYEDKGEIDGIATYAVSGTPADCVLFGLKHLFKDERIDAIVSGINTCLNAGSDIIFSGTFGAAQEGTFQHLPSLAVSLRTRGVEDYEYAADFTARNLETLLGYADENTTINLNIPCAAKDDIKGVKIAPVAYQPYNESYVKKADSNGLDCYFVDGHKIRHTDERTGGDCYWLDQGYITVTPVRLISNDFERIQALKKVRLAL